MIRRLLRRQRPGPTAHPSYLVDFSCLVYRYSASSCTIPCEPSKPRSAGRHCHASSSIPRAVPRLDAFPRPASTPFLVYGTGPRSRWASEASAPGSVPHETPPCTHRGAAAPPRPGSVRNGTSVHFEPQQRRCSVSPVSGRNPCYSLSASSRRLATVEQTSLGNRDTSDR